MTLSFVVLVYVPVERVGSVSSQGSRGGRGSSSVQSPELSVSSDQPDTASSRKTWGGGGGGGGILWHEDQMSYTGFL